MSEDDISVVADGLRLAMGLATVTGDISQTNAKLLKGWASQEIEQRPESDQESVKERLNQAMQDAYRRGIKFESDLKALAINFAAQANEELRAKVLSLCSHIAEGDDMKVEKQFAEISEIVEGETTPLRTSSENKSLEKSDAKEETPSASSQPEPAAKPRTQVNQRGPDVLVNTQTSTSSSGDTGPPRGRKWQRGIMVLTVMSIAAGWWFVDKTGIPHSGKGGTETVSESQSVEATESVDPPKIWCASAETVKWTTKGNCRTDRGGVVFHDRTKAAAEHSRLKDEQSNRLTEAAASTPRIMTKPESRLTGAAASTSGSMINSKPAPSRPVLVEASLPDNGAVINSLSGEREAPFEIRTRGTSHYLVKLQSQYSSNQAMTIFVQSGRTIDITVPLGRYELRFASGDKWYGYDKLFGPETAYSKGEGVMNFTKQSTTEGYRVLGHTVTLYAVAGGNYKTSRIDASNF